MLNKLFFFVCFIIFAIFMSCSDGEQPHVEDGSINVAVFAVFPDTDADVDTDIDESARQPRATGYNRIFLRILDDADVAIRDTSVTPNPLHDVILCGFANIPAGKQYKIVAWTQDNEGFVIHTPDTQAVFVETNAYTNVVLSLQPRVGSIVAQFAIVPASINKFIMVFDSDSGLFQTEAARVVNTYIALNRVPYGANGKLTIRAQRTDGTFYIDWDTTNFTFRRENIFLQLSFLQRDAMQVSVNIRSPYNTVFTAFADINRVLGEEKNIGVLMTEFCVNGSDNADFVQVANLSDSVVSFNELRLEAVGTSRQEIIARDVVIEPMTTFIFGHHTAPNYWDNIDITGNLALVSTSAILLLYGDGELLDYVIYFNYNNVNSGWSYTSSSGRRSWVLKELVPNPQHNNHGSAWRLSTDTALVDAQNRVWFGTPGILR